MKFRGKVEAQGSVRFVEFEIQSPRPSTKAPYECVVTTDYPRPITATLFGVDEQNAHESAVTFLRGLVGEARITTLAGAPVDLGPAADLPKDGPTRVGIGAPGLAVSMVTTNDGGLRLVIEHVHRSASGWALDCLSTHNDYERAKLTAMALTPEQYGEIGFNIVLSLLAQAGLLERERGPS